MGGWAAGGELYFSIGLTLFRVAMSPRRTSYRPRQAWGPKECLANTG